jgi:hypothetical protein
LDARDDELDPETVAGRWDVRDGLTAGECRRIASRAAGAALADDRFIAGVVEFLYATIAISSAVCQRTVLHFFDPA